MTLIKCPECKKEISDKAGECPQCGNKEFDVGLEPEDAKRIIKFLRNKDETEE